MARIEATQEHLDERFSQPGTALNRVLQEAPYLPRCSDDKTARYQRPREYAVRYPYMQINRRGFVSWLIFDLDHAQPFIWEDVNLPPPNLIVQNRDNCKSHLFYAIPPVCTSKNGREKPIAYMKAVYSAIASRLKADTAFHSGPVAKTPGHRWWRTSELHSRVYELGELADCVELDPPTRQRKKTVDIADISHSRHKLLFEFVRHYAYAIVNREREQGNFDIFHRLVDAFAYNKNNFGKYGFSSNLPQSSIRATVRSITRWTWEHYTGSSRCHRGAMRMDDSLPLEERQRLAAERTHGMRRQATESKIRAACSILKKRGKELTYTAIGKLARLTRQTIASYKSLLDTLSRPAEIIQLTTPGRHSGSVKYGAHQVSGGLVLDVEDFALGGSAGKLIDDDGS